jgi:ubiquinone/menaquinone biosynthesis C-methylase UbiE
MSRYNKKISYDFYTESMKNWEKKGAVRQKRIFKIAGSLKNKTVLDAGCGFGYDTDAIDKKKAKVFGIDISGHIIKIAKEKYPHLSKVFFVSDIKKIPFKDNFFDLIISKYAVHYLNNPDLAFKEFFRCLKKDGILIISVHHPMSVFFLKKSKDYFKKKEITVKIFGKIKISQPSHTLTDYLSAYFLNHFDLLYAEEKQGTCKIFKNMKIPEYLLIKAKKR